MDNTNGDSESEKQRVRDKRVERNSPHLSASKLIHQSF